MAYFTNIMPDTMIWIVDKQSAWQLYMSTNSQSGHVCQSITYLRQDL